MSNIPSNVDEVFQELKTEVTWLHARWIMYRQLFAQSPKRIDLLNECASTFFYTIQDVLIGDVQIALSKLTDRARTGANENLSLEQLQKRVEKQGEPNLQPALRQILDELKQKCLPFRTWRNKRLAHLDLTTAMKSTLNPLPGVSRQMIEEALDLVRRYLNAIQIHYEKSETGYEHFSMPASDGEALISMLKYGLRYEQLVQER
ncbi:MAG: hypothetical protein JRD93_17835 [Deltaproteobacteria bacterium]|nr:hypothetical protein [Deltaproteobacteria bacterium]